MKRILVVGATSAIAHETARRFAADGACLFLAARDPARLQAVASDLEACGAGRAHTAVFDAAEVDTCRRLLPSAIEQLGGLDAVLVAHGELPDLEHCESDVEAAMQSLAVNGVSAVRLLMAAAEYFGRQRRGCIAAISSASGERGRRSSYVYGMGKSLVTTCMQGLRARLFPLGVSVVTVLPCFIDTPMTAYLPARVRWISPATAGRRIYRAMLRGSDVVYIPRYWRFAVWALRNVPEGWMKRLRDERKLVGRL